jgi:hypothetical protein
MRIGEAVEWNYTTPNVTLRSEWDIESVILDTYKELGLQFTFLHVKSHQDDDGPVSGLSLEAQLNVEADLLATEYLKETDTNRPIALLFPTAKCQLIINGKSITRKIPECIRFEAGSIGIRSYLMNRNLWNEQTLDDINWDAHGAGHSSHRSHRCYLVKLCHRHLPIGKTLHRRDHKYSPTCPGCRAEPESQDHYLQCAAPSRMLWRIKLITTLRKKLDNLNTDPNLQESILHCIDSALAGRDIAITGPFRDAIEAQARIGWLSMLRGYWTKEWQKAYERTYPTPQEETRKDKNKRTLKMTRWQRRIIHHTWTGMTDLWNIRNEERHGWDKESRDNARREVLHTELADIYGRKHQYPLRVQRLLRESYEIHIQETVTKLADWLDAYKGTFAITWSPD